MDPTGTVYRTSLAELDRRREAYTRLVLCITLGATVASADLLLDHPLHVGPALVALLGVLLLSRVYFSRLFDRYARIVWRVEGQELLRDADGSSDRYPLAQATDMRVKRTSDGRVRAIGLDFSTSKSLYINALESPEDLLDRLRGLGVPESVGIREPIDYDNPWFYRLLGLAIGAALSTVGRLAADLNEGSARIAYVVIALYMIAFGVYWLRTLPLAPSYGQGKHTLDVIVGCLALLGGVAIGIGGLVVL
jgi:hypothetical protein